MYKTNNYVPTDKMSDLICGNYTLLQVMSRFDLSLGFGDQTVQEVCRANGVDCKTFLAVVNFITEENNRMADEVQDLSIHALMNYLKQAHHYFLDFQLPTIRRKLIEAIDCSVQNEVAFLILKFFDAYVASHAAPRADSNRQNQCDHSACPIDAGTSEIKQHPPTKEDKYLHQNQADRIRLQKRLHRPPHFSKYASKTPINC